jgi:hypothetical protein
MVHDRSFDHAVREIEKRKAQALECATNYRKLAEQCDGMAEAFSQALFELSKVRDEA